MQFSFRAGLASLAFVLFLLLPTHAAPIISSSSLAHHKPLHSLTLKPSFDTIHNSNRLESSASAISSNDGVAARDIALPYRRGFFDSIANGFKSLGGAIKNVAQKVGGGVANVAKKVAGGAKNVVKKVASGVKTVAKKVGQGVKKAANVVKKVATKVGSGVKKVAKTVGHAIKTGGAVVAKVGLKALSTAQKAASKVVQFIPVIGKPLSKVLSVEGSLINKASNAIHANVKGFGKAQQALDGMNKAQSVMKFIPREVSVIQERDSIALSERDLHEINILLNSRDEYDTNWIFERSWDQWEDTGI